MLWEDNYLAHYGIKGQKWGVRRFQNEDGTLTEEGKRRYRQDDVIFVSGSSKTQDKSSNYYRRELPKQIKEELDSGIKAGSKFVIGDAPGIDRQVQNYLNSKKYDRVEIYGPGKEIRYTANKKWKTHLVDDPDHTPGSKEWLAKKDEAMTSVATVGLAIVLDEGAKATRANVQRLADQNKDVKVFSLNKNGDDNWANSSSGFDRNKYLDDEQTAYDKNKKNINTFLKVTAGIAAASIVGYSLYKGHQYMQQYGDVKINAGSIISRIQTDSKQKMSDHPFYASFRKDDTLLYKSELSNWRKTQGKNVFLSTANVLKNMRIAGSSNAEKIFNRLVKENSEFKNGIDKINSSPFKVIPTSAKTQYEIFNATELVDKPTTHNKRLREIFYEALGKSGYDGIIDVNDKNGLYRTTSPVIIFNTKKLTNNYISEFSDKSISDATSQLTSLRKHNARINSLIKTMASADKKVATISSSLTGIGLLTKYSVNAVHSKREEIANYRKDHPNTKLSDRDIYEMLIKNKH